MKNSDDFPFAPIAAFHVVRCQLALRHHSFLFCLLTSDS